MAITQKFEFLFATINYIIYHLKHMNHKTKHTIGHNDCKTKHTDTILSYWFPNDQYQKFWFDGSKDEEIYNNFYDILINIDTADTEVEEKDIFAKLILFDQIARNICRYKNISNIGNIGYTYLDISLSLANLLLSTNADHKYPIYQRIFMLLPLRHSRITSNLNIVMNRIQIYIKDCVNESDIGFLNRFRLATLKDYSLVTDTIEIIHTPLEQHPSYDPIIHDDICCNMKIAKSINIEAFTLYQNVKKYLFDNNIDRVAVSLSGGVDSNVLLYIFHHMRETNIIKSLVAIHVNYNFRDESSAEANYLYEVCRYMNIPMITRKIEQFPIEIYNIVGRNFYEEETKELRFNLYKYVIKKYHIQGICLGHHKDDLIENVFMNLMKGRDLLELFNMPAFAIINNVPIIRPMLQNPKIDIYKIATKYGIMYFKDTTPDWSFRGTMRRKIFPEIEKFDSSMLNNLIKRNSANEL